jgi:hypothetical protein
MPSNINVVKRRMEIDTIALLALSSIVVAASSYVIMLVNCRRRPRERRDEEPKEMEQVPVVAPESPKDWGVQNPVAYI